MTRPVMLVLLALTRSRIGGQMARNRIRVKILDVLLNCNRRGRSLAGKLLRVRKHQRVQRKNREDYDRDGKDR